MILDNNTFTVLTAIGEVPIFAYRTDKDNTFLETKDVSICIPNLEKIYHEELFCKISNKAT